MICKHWREYDKENGQLYEYCKLTRKICYCCGTLKQCNFPEKRGLKLKSFVDRFFRIIKEV